MSAPFEPRVLSRSGTFPHIHPFSPNFSRSVNFPCFPAKSHDTFPLGNIMFKHYVTPAEIGATVRSVRKAQKLRQDQLAGVANVGLRFIVDLEAGKPTAQIGKVLTVLAALGVTMEMKVPEARENS
jgi:y4mF family transcriptional regulator